MIHVMLYPRIMGGSVIELSTSSVTVRVSGSGTLGNTVIAK